MQDWGWMESPHLISGIWLLLLFTETRIRVTKNVHELSSCKIHKLPTRKKSHWMIDDLDIVDSKRGFFSSGSYFVHLWRQRSSDQDDHKGKKSYNETCFQNPQSCSWLVIWQNQFGPQDPNQTLWHQTPTRRHTDQREISQRDEWNNLLRLVNISHFSSINSFKAMSKRTQGDAGEERVTAKSKPMMNLVSRYIVSDPIVLASTVSENPENTKLKVRKYLWAR